MHPVYDPEFRARWVRALRNGRRKQARFVLRQLPGYWEDPTNAAKFCCLGVACDIDKESEWDGPEVIAHDIRGRKYRLNSYLPNRLRIRLGLSVSQMRTLARLNDEKCYTFNQIADVVDSWEPHIEAVK